MSFVYLDNAASTKPHPIINESFKYINDNFYANPSAVHSFGIEAEKILDHSRYMLSSFLKCNQNEIIFTSGATESINIALRGIFHSYGRKRKTILTTQTEHAAVYETLMHLQKQFDAKIVFLKLDKDGRIDLNSLKENLNDNVLMISITHINNETGVINPVRTISEIVKGYLPDTFIHIDAVQSFCKSELHSELALADLYSCSAHKVHGPKGLGFLYSKEGIRLENILTGGEQERKIRPGTTNLPLIYSFYQMISFTKNEYLDDYKHVSKLNEYFKKHLSNSDIDAKINFNNYCSPYIISVSFAGIKSEILVHQLEEEDIIVSAGAACSSRKSKNRVLSGYGLSEKEAAATIRISFSHYNTRIDVGRLFGALKSIFKKTN